MADDSMVSDKNEIEIQAQKQVMEIRNSRPSDSPCSICSTRAKLQTRANLPISIHLQ